MNILSRKIPFYYFILCIILAAAVTYFLARHPRSNAIDNNKQSPATSENNLPKPDCRYDITRLTCYAHVSPIMSAAGECEARNLMPLKSSISDYIDREKKAGKITTASMYMRKLRNYDWMNVNGDEQFRPAALLKVPMLIAYFRMTETIPGLLEKEYVYNPPSREDKYYSAKTLQPGHKYTIMDMFHFMIAYSDEAATNELSSHLNKAIYYKVFADLKLPTPECDSANYTINARDYSRFLEVLYNAAYLSMPSSEYVTKILAEASFKDGIIKKIPRDVLVAHKMGEWGNDSSMELHDCGIVYIDHNPYIITVMTRGTDMEKLSEVIGTISKLVYDAMATAK